MWPTLVAGLALAAPELPEDGEGAPAMERASPARSWSLLPLPTLDVAPEVGVSGGAVLLFSDRPFASARPMVVEAEAALTTRRQAIVETEVQVFTREDRFLVETRLDWLRYPEDEWGLGNQTLEGAAEAFSADRLEGSASVFRRPGSSVFLGPVLRFQDVSRLRAAPGSRLDRNAVPGASGGLSLGAGGAVRWDDRARPLTPAPGEAFAQLTQLAFSPVWGSDHRFGRTDLDARAFLGLGPALVALRARLVLHTGVPPFRMLALLGGEDTVRSYTLGRYRDQHLAAAQAEVRVPVWWRLGVVGFVDAGDVFGPNSSTTLDQIKPAAGAGLRVRLDDEEGTNLRIDGAVGRSGWGLYAGFGEAF